MTLNKSLTLLLLSGKWREQDVPASQAHCEHGIYLDTVVWGAAEVCEVDRCVTAPQQQLQQRTACSGFPQDWVKRLCFLPPLYFLFFFFFFKSAILYTICLFTGVDLESGCSLKDEGVWGCKRARFSLIWILTKVDTLHILPHLTPICLLWQPLALKFIVEKHWYRDLLSDKSALT